MMRYRDIFARYARVARCCYALLLRRAGVYYAESVMPARDANIVTRAR